MLEAIGQSLPIAVGVLISPLPIVAVVLMLVSRRATGNGVAFVVGWMVGIALLGLVLLLVLGATDLGDASEPPTWAAVLKLVLGLLLVAVGIWQWRGRPRGDVPGAAPGWMARIERFTPPKAFGLALVLGTVNPKNLLLIVAGATAIAQATSSGSEQIAALVVFTVVASLGVAVPVLLYLVMGSRAAGPLDELKVWMVDNNAAIMSVLLLVLGATMLGDGLTGLG